MGPTLDTTSSTDTFSSSLGSPVTAASNIRNKVKQIQNTLHQHHNNIEETNIELKRVRQMLDPLRLSMKGYTDQLETNTDKQFKDAADAQDRENNRIDSELIALREENKSLKNTISKMQQQMDRMASSIAQIQGQVFGDYESENLESFKSSKESVVSDNVQ